MKKAVITILGTIGGKLENGVFKQNGNKSFYSGIGLENVEYFNMLPLLIDRYKDYEIVPFYTEYAKKIQEGVLKLENKSTSILDKGVLIEDENDFNEIFELIDKKISEYDRVIVDVTHGFRHLPLLMLIDLLVQNIKNPDKIEHILFAKELVKPAPDNDFVGKYEIIDLRKYLDLASITYALSTFTKNYTISSTIKTSVKEYNKFLEDLSDFSFHILANSLKELSNKAHNLINQIDEIMEKENEVFKVFNNYLLDIKRHMEYINEISKEKKDYKRLYFFSKNMFEKGYLLNSITLLSEAIGMYVAEEILSKNRGIKNYIDSYKKSRNYQAYVLSNNSKNIVRFSNRYVGKFLNNEDESYERKITKKVKNFNFNGKREIISLIITIDKLRNNLAHGNSSEPIEDVKEKIKYALDEFKKITKVE